MGIARPISILFSGKLLIAVCLISGLIISGSVASAAWETVGTAGFSAGQAWYTSLAFDGSTPYVAYMDGGNFFNKATVMRFNGNKWETVGTAGFSANQANYTSLAFDGSTPYVAYMDEGNSYKATVMKYDETLPTPAWVLVGTAGFSAGEAYNTSLAFDGSTPYVAYMDGGNGSRATVMKYDDTLSTPAWVLVGTAGFSAGGALYTSLAFDGSTPYVTYRDGGNSDKASVMKFVAAPASTIPTLNEWGLILLSLLLAGTALIAIRRHRRTSA